MIVSSKSSSMATMLRSYFIGAVCLAAGCNGNSDATTEAAKVGKHFKLSADQIKPIAKGYGACFATDKITVEGHRVRFMYREEPDNEVDSGWRFMSGLESDEYMDDAANHGVYDVNTIANYDSDIIPFLDAEVGAAFEREDEVGEFNAVEFEPPSD